MRAPALVALSLLAATGCDGVFGLTGGGGDDERPTDAGSGSDRDGMLPTDACAPASSFMASRYSDLGSGLSAPTLSDDQLELFFVSAGNLATATRPSATDTFGMPTKLGFGAEDIASVSDPTLTLDGLDMLFIVHAPVAGIYEMTRAQTSMPWSMPKKLLNSEPDGGIDLSPDGLLLYVQVGGNVLYQLSRSDRSHAFLGAQPLGIAAPGPSVTEGGHRIYFNEGGQIMTATRVDVAGAFGTPTPFANNGDPVVGSDVDASVAGGTLVLVQPDGSSTVVTILTNGCP